jgi:hypothetical protein
MRKSICSYRRRGAGGAYTPLCSWFRKVSAASCCAFGKVLRDSDNKPLVYAPGLHFKSPVSWNPVKTLDARIQTMDNQADRFRDQREERPDRRFLPEMAYQRFQPLLSGNGRR